MIRGILTMAMLIVIPLCVQAGTLRVGEPEIQGTTVVLPVILDGDASGVAALDFTLSYDPAVFEPVGAEPGPATVAARKQVQSNETSPGSYVVMMFGMNQTTIENGQIAAITLSAKALPATNESQVVLDSTTLASVDGFEIASEGSTQTITFARGPVDENPTEPTPPDQDGETPKAPDAPTPVPPTPQPSPQSPSEPEPGRSPLPSPPGGGNSESPRDSGARPSPFLMTPPEIAPAPLAGTAGRLARLNAAAQRLESARMSLNAPVTGNGQIATEDEPSDEPAAGQSESPLQAEGTIQAIDETEMRVALAAPSSPVADASTTQEPASVPSANQVIDDSTRRWLTAFLIMVAVGAIALRLRNRRAS